MDRIPLELLQEISHFLDGSALLRFTKLSKKFRQLKVKFRTKLPKDVQYNGEEIHFQQQGEDLMFVRVNGIDRPTEKYPLGRRRGVRTLGDRTIVSSVPLGYQQRSFGEFVKEQAVYFEVYVLQTSDPLQSMRIGLVHPQWDQSRPPGSLTSSVGLCR